MQKLIFIMFMLTLAGCSSTNAPSSNYLPYDSSNSTPRQVNDYTAVNVQMSDNQDVDKTMQIENESDVEENIITYADYE